MEFELILRGGSVVDGTGAEPVAADVAVASGRIAGVGRLDGARGVAEVDVTGRYLMPGLVDTHVHLEGLLDDPSSWLALLRQGVTTVMLGQDGLSFAPASPVTVHYVQRYFGTVTGPPPAGLREGASVSSLLQWYDLRAPVNVAYLVPAGTVRHEVVGTAARPATVDELGVMVALVRQGMEEGAVGLSTGLEYVPGAFADTAELGAMCAPVAEAGGVYVSHLRSYSATGIGAAMAELREIVAGSGAAGHASHYRGPSAVLGPLLDGFDVTFDSYPYLVGSTILAMRALPASLQAGGPEATLDRLADRDTRRRLASQWEADTSLRRVVLAFVGGGRFASAEGLALAEAAERFGLSFGEFVGELLVDSRLAVACVLDAPPSSGSEEDTRALLRHEAHMACSDGLYTGSHPHPRGHGAFARFLGRHTRELGDWTWGRAALHLAGRPARRFGLAGRGLLAPGAVADIAVVDPATVVDTATYDEPRRLAVGVDRVLVGGVPVLVAGELTGARPGRALRRGTARA